MSHIVIDGRIIRSSTGTYVQKLLQYLQQFDQHNRYTILVPRGDTDVVPLTNPRFSYAICDIANYSWAEQTALKAQLEQLAPDLVHFCMPQQPVGYQGASVTTFHDLTLLNTYNSDKNWLLFRTKQLVGRWVFGRVLAKADHIITPSQYTKDDILRRFRRQARAEHISVLYEAAEPARTSLTPYRHPFARFLLYVGQQSDYKNLRRLAAAHQQLLATHPDLGLILVGAKNASAQANQAYFQRRGYRNIHFTGFLPDQQRDWLYTQAAAYVFPSLMEGFGLPGLEAMAYRTPLVSSNATCLPEVYGDGAHYFNPRDSHDMAEAIRQVLDDADLRARLVAQADRVVAGYSWQRMAKQTLAVYQSVLTQRAAVPDKQADQAAHTDPATATRPNN